MKVKNIIKMVLQMSLVFTSVTINGQISQEGLPYSFNPNFEDENNKVINSLPELVPVIQMPQINRAQIDSILAMNNKRKKVFQFAFGFDVNINLKESALVDSLESGLLFRLGIRSPGAYSINLIFKEYKVPPGAKLFIYDKTQKDITGAFTSNNNKASGIFPVAPVAGDEIIIEYFEPYFSEFSSQLLIGKVSHDFLDFLHLNKIGYGDSGACNVDINCPEGNNWQNDKRGVCKIMFNGSSVCSGTLLNNTSLDGLPYFLTANHCIGSQSEAQSAIFIFNYESPSCSGGNGSESQSVSGADLIANRAASDFSLLKLSKTPPSSFNPFYAGWDNRNQIKNNVVGIHHPEGDVKKISVENGTIQSTALYSNINDIAADFWRVGDWDVGVTEEGSSGSALFDNDHRVIGQLQGGSAACNGNNDNNLPDWYGKFSTSWDAGAAADERLRDWLDPSNITDVLDGAGICKDGLVQNINITHTITSGSTELHQAVNRIEASNTVESGAIATYEAGNHIDLNLGFNAEAGSNFLAHIVPINCVPGCYPMNLTAWTSFVCKGGDLCFNITNASEYTISIYASNGALVHQASGSIVGNSICVWNTFSAASGIYVVKVTFNSDCEEISNSYQLLVSPCGDSEDGDSKDILDKELVEFQKQDIDFEVYPNPNNGKFSLALNTSQEFEYSLEIINSVGLLIYKREKINARQVEINQANISKGMYFIRLICEDNYLVKPIIIE